ncbi:MAG TPA: hypothetical protein VHW25_19480 [Steroidobacteraceae bacterium]|nr:hypothetical protein [Steroidobacteraceae bacterium]
MNIIEMIKQGLRVARTSRSLWLYGFFVGLAATANNAHRGHAPAPPAAHVPTVAMAVLGVAGLAVIAAAIFMYFVSEGALIEGVRRLRLAEPPTLRKGWHDGLAHWGVLLRIAVIYFATSAASLAALATPFLLALKLSGTTLAVILAIPAALIAVPWLATLYMWQAFAARIAVIENRHALDAIGKARLFLHGRLLHGLKLIVAAILGRTIVLIAGSVGIAAAALSIFLVQKALGLATTAVPLVALGAIVLLPLIFILIAISGTTQSSIWTIGYLTQEQK